MVMGVIESYHTIPYHIMPYHTILIVGWFRRMFAVVVVDGYGEILIVGWFRRMFAVMVVDGYGEQAE